MFEVKPSETMNCHPNGVCGKYGHSLDLHHLEGGELVCDHCSARHATEPYPKHLHLVPEAAKAMMDVTREVTVVDPETKTPTQRLVTTKVEKVGFYFCSNCKAEVQAGHVARCDYPLPHVNCHLWSKW